jgi:hypothetical protein
MSKFVDKDMELYRSSDGKNTSIYFCNSKDRFTKTSFFELLIVDNTDVYIRYPETDFFVQLYGVAYNSAHGSMKVGSVQDVWENKFHKQIDLHYHDQNMMLKIGGKFGKINFLNLVAKKDKYLSELKSSGKLINDHTAVLPFGEDELHQKMVMKFLQLPEEIREIAHAKKLVTPFETLFFIVDYPQYKPFYKNYRFRVIDEDRKVINYPIVDTTTYRDGGTTKIKVLDPSGNEHVFFYPSPLSFASKKCTWDGETLIDVPENELQELITLLNIQFAPIEENIMDIPVVESAPLQIPKKLRAKWGINIQ